jgi:beta-lactamase regulating signal transducer with metallopeptidase domain
MIMLEHLFVSLVNMSIASSIIAVVIIGIRFFLNNRLPKIFSYALWAILLIRLLIPFSFISTLSIFNALPTPVATTITQGSIGLGAAQFIPENIETAANPEINTENNAGNSLINNSLPAAGQELSDNSMQNIIFAASWIWLLGTAFLFAISMFMYLRTESRLRTAVLYREESIIPGVHSNLKLKRKVPVYISDRISTPIVCGFVSPRIILPLFLTQNGNETALQHIMTHELVHIKRMDYLIKPLSMLALCMHWFNPLIWISFILSQKDMESSCDEKVLSISHIDIKSSYATLLIHMAAKQNSLLNGGLLAFGESNIKSRIKNIMDYKKPGYWIIATTVATLIALGIILLTNANWITAKANSIKLQENILSNNTIHLNNDSKSYTLVVKMMVGRYYEDSEPGPFMGKNWEGQFKLQLKDDQGTTISDLDLNEAFKEEKLNFQNVFDIEFDDYNNDGYKDFFIGQYASSNGNDYKLFTITSTGKIEILPIKGQSEIFSSGGNRYSKKFEKIGLANFINHYYDNSQGKNIDIYYMWSDKEKQFELMPGAAISANKIDKQPALAAESPPPSATIVDSSLPEIIPFTDILAIDNANLNNGGNSWSQQSGYDYARVYISNTSSQTLNVYLSYDLSGSKQNIGNYTVSANGTLTINVTHASGHVFYVDYNTANGVVSGKISVRSSDVPL